MKHTLFLTFLFITVFPIMNICTGTSALAQRWSNESGSLWNFADETGEYTIKRCDYCNEFICGNSKEVLERNMQKHLRSCPAYLFNLNNQTNTDNNDNDDDDGLGGSSSDNNSSGGNSGNNNNSNATNAIKVVDLLLATSIMSQMGLGNRNAIITEYESNNFSYIYYPYVSLKKFLTFVQQIYDATYTTHSYAYGSSFIGLRANNYAIELNGNYLVTHNMYTYIDNNNYIYDYVIVF